MKTGWTFKHCLGNMIAGFIQIIEGLILIITLGFGVTALSFRFCSYRLKHGFLNNSVVRHEPTEDELAAEESEETRRDFGNDDDVNLNIGEQIV